MRLSVALRFELLALVRYRFLHAAIFSGALWVVVLLPIPADLRAVVEPYVVFGDLAIVGFFFIAGSVFFDKDQGTLAALATTPLRFGEYFAAKLLTLTAVTVALSVGVATATRGFAYHLPLLVLGSALCALPMLFAGFASSLPFDSVSDWFMLSALPLAVLSLPLFAFAGVWESPLHYLIPTQGPLLLIGEAFGQKTPNSWQHAYAVAYPLVFALVLWGPVRRLHRRYALEGAA